MPKSRDGQDGRRNNRPPIHGQIQRREIRNPYGCKGKPKPAHLSPIEELYLAEAERIVSRDEDGSVSAAKRLVQEEFHAALQGKDTGARTRVLDRLSQATSIAAQKHAEIIAWFIESRAHVAEQFYFAQIAGRPAPDIVPHPEHVEITEDQVIFCGPADRRGRDAWEALKYEIKVTAFLHQQARAAFRNDPTSLNEFGLKAMERHRRLLMRHVPKGWNWREEIFCRSSRTAQAKQTISLFEDRDENPCAIAH